MLVLTSSLVVLLLFPVSLLTLLSNGPSSLSSGCCVTVVLGDGGDDESSPVDMGSGDDAFDDVDDDASEDPDGERLATALVLRTCAGRDRKVGFLSGRETPTAAAAAAPRSGASCCGGRSGQLPVGAFSTDLSMVEVAADAAAGVEVATAAGVGTLR